MRVLTVRRDLTSYFFVFFVRIFTILFFLRRLHFSVTEIDFGAKEKVETGEGQNIYIVCVCLSMKSLQWGEISP